MSQAPHNPLGQQTLTDRTLRGLIGTVDDIIVTEQATFRSDGQRLSSFRPILPFGVSAGFAGTGGMTFTVVNDPATGLITYRYLMITQELMFVDVYVSGTIGGTVSTGLRLPLPVGYTIAGSKSRTPCQIYTGGTYFAGVFVLSPQTSPNFIEAYLINFANYTLGTAAVIGQVHVNVTPLA